MNRRQAIAAGVATISVTAAVSSAVTSARADDITDESGKNPELEKIRALLKAHDDALTSHDIDGVLKTLADDATVMGTGPGEMWSGKEELKDAYHHFCEVFDKGAQHFEYLSRAGHLSSDMGWMMSSGNVEGKKDGKDFAYPLNVSLTVAKHDGHWKIAAMHFSTLVAPELHEKKA